MSLLVDGNITAKINTMEMVLHGPRRIAADTRRVCLPTAITKELGWRKGALAVTVRRHRSRAELLVEACPREELRRELSSHRPRPFDRQGQVTLPVGLMTELGLGDEQPWVYFARALRPRGVRIIPQPIALRGWGQVPA